MSIIDKVIQRIEDSNQNDHNCISFKDLTPRFSNFIPGINQATYYGITGAPSSGKTQFTDFTFLYHVFDFCLKNHLEFEIVYFTFEISKEAKILRGISKRLFERHGLRLPTNILQKRGEGLSPDQLDKVKKVRNYFEELEKFVTFYDEPLTPSQIFKIQMDKVRENGKFIGKEYIPNNVNKYLIFITDHISLIQPDPGQTLHQALSSFSSNNIFLRNKFGCTIVNVHQQGTEGQVEQFTSKGDNIASKLEPKLAGLGDNRTLARDYDLVLGLFSPYKHELAFYRGYKTNKFMDKSRWLSIIKNREGDQDINVGLYFDGAVGYFEELPKAENFSIQNMGQKVDNDQLYEKYLKGFVGPNDPSIQKSFTF